MSNITKLSNIIIIVALLVVYVHFFGYDTVERFSKRGVTTVTTTEKHSTITPPSKNIQFVYNTMNTNNTFFNPGITVQVENGWVGWKIDERKGKIMPTQIC